MELNELLRQVGLTQYEAEAYGALLREGPLTGYELGKRSRVPLPRSYDVLERLVERGLALVQPGDPPRYRAEDPAHLLHRLRGDMTARLDALQAELEAVAPRDAGGELWVVRGEEPLRARIAAMIGVAEQRIELVAAASLGAVVEAELAEARGRGCAVGWGRGGDSFPDDAVLALIDGAEVLAGTLAPEGQAVVTRNRALVALARSTLATGRSTFALVPAGAEPEPAGDWLQWENEKHRRLRLLAGGSDVA